MILSILASWPFHISILILGFVHPKFFGYTYSLGVIGMILAAKRADDRKVVAPEDISIDELSLFYRYHLTLNSPEEAGNYADFLMRAHAMTFVWIPLLLWHHLIFPAIVLGLAFWLGHKIIAVLDPWRFLRGARQRGDKDMEARFVSLEGLAKKLGKFSGRRFNFEAAVTLMKEKEASLLAPEKAPVGNDCSIEVFDVDPVAYDLLTGKPYELALPIIEEIEKDAPFVDPAAEVQVQMLVGVEAENIVDCLVPDSEKEHFKGVIVDLKKIVDGFIERDQSDLRFRLMLVAVAQEVAYCTYTELGSTLQVRPRSAFSRGMKGDPLPKRSCFLVAQSAVLAHMVRVTAYLGLGNAPGRFSNRVDRAMARKVANPEVARFLGRLYKDHASEVAVLEKSKKILFAGIEGDELEAHLKKLGWF